MKLYFRKIGEGNPLIILHGLFGSSDNWQTLGRKFSENNFSVYLVDQRNHGHSPHSDEHSFKAMGNDILELIENEKIKDASIIGHSMGAKTAMQFALDHPERISKLICVDMSPKKYPVMNRDIAEALSGINLDLIKSRKDVEKKLSEKIKDSGTLQLLLKSLYWKEPDMLAWRFNLKAIKENIENMSEEINEDKAFNKPTLFIRGENSNYILKENELLIKKYFLSAEIKAAPFAGHWVHADNPEWFFTTCLEFLNK